MQIALDHDGTYTEDPAFWNAFIDLAREHGHIVVCVTMRHRHETISMPCEVVYTGRLAKAKFCTPDVWIDDNPRWLYADSN